MIILYGKCELTPAQAAVPSWNCCGQMKVSASFQMVDCKRFLSELLCLPFYPTTLFLDIKLVGAPISDDSSTLFELKVITSVYAVTLLPNLPWGGGD